mgnify:CR=1 FL=1|tara:strand:- start:815 stop:1090 length:276 start_codon:yes stop_codon:yes gene_type:complete
METKKKVLNKIFRNDPQGILGEKTMPIESRDKLIEILSFSLNNSNVFEDFKFQISLDFPSIELNNDSPIWNEIEGFIIDKIIEDNEITFHE